MSESLAMVISTLKACVISTKDGVPLNQLDSKFSFLLKSFLYILNFNCMFVCLILCWHLSIIISIGTYI